MHQRAGVNLRVEAGKMSGLGHELLVRRHFLEACEQAELEALEASCLGGLDREDGGKWPIQKAEAQRLRGVNEDPIEITQEDDVGSFEASHDTAEGLEGCTQGL